MSKRQGISPEDLGKSLGLMFQLLQNGGKIVEIGFERSVTKRPSFTFPYVEETVPLPEILMVICIQEFEVRSEGQPVNDSWKRGG